MVVSYQPLHMGPMGCLETSAMNYHSALRKPSKSDVIYTAAEACNGVKKKYIYIYIYDVVEQ